MAIHAPISARDILVEDLSGNETYKISLDDAGADGYLTYCISRAGNDEIIVWSEETDNVFRMDLRDMSYSVCKMHGKGKNEYLFPICSDDSSDGNEVILFGGSRIARYIQGEMQAVDIPVAEVDLYKCLRESGYIGRDLYSRSGNKEGIYMEDWLFGIGGYIEMIKLV